MDISRRGFLMAVGAAGMAIPAMASINGIQIGVCAPTSGLEDIAQYGFDYLEPPASAVSAMSEPAFQAFRKKVLASPVRCECYSDFIPPRWGLRMAGDHIDWGKLRPYLEHTLARCRQLGGSVVVWGNPGSRNVPPGFSSQKAWNQIKDYLRRAGNIARRHNLTIAIEPLRPRECNIINTGAEALQMVQEVQHPNVKMMIDYYVMRVENENPDIIWKARKEIVHFHFANPNGRLWPKSPAEDPEYGAFFRYVKKIHFHGGISIDAHGSFAEDATASLEFFRNEITSA